MNSGFPSLYVGVDDLNTWSMIRDCGLENESMSAAQLDIIFTRADLDDDMSRNNILEPQDYIEALVRIATAHAATKKGSTNATPDEVTEALKELLEGTLASRAGKSDADAFRAMLNESTVREVYRTNRDDLRLIFAKYAAADMTAVNKKSTMNLKEFELMLKDGNLLTGGMTQQVMGKIFANVQNDIDVNEMDYTEFLESIAAMCCYRDGNPYTTFDKKLKTFIESRFIPSLAPEKKK